MAYSKAKLKSNGDTASRVHLYRLLIYMQLKSNIIKLLTKTTSRKKIGTRHKTIDIIIF
jgi:hypothetical protein